MMNTVIISCLSSHRLSLAPFPKSCSHRPSTQSLIQRTLWGLGLPPFSDGLQAAIAYSSPARMETGWRQVSARGDREGEVWCLWLLCDPSEL